MQNPESPVKVPDDVKDLINQKLNEAFLHQPNLPAELRQSVFAELVDFYAKNQYIPDFKVERVVTAEDPEEDAPVDAPERKRCEKCGCDDEHPCLLDQTPCHWMPDQPDVCSACVLPALQVKADEAVFERFDLLQLAIHDLKAIAQNDMQLTAGQLSQWNQALESVVKCLFVIQRAVLRSIEEGNSLVPDVRMYPDEREESRLVI